MNRRSLHIGFTSRMRMASSRVSFFFYSIVLFHLVVLIVAQKPSILQYICVDKGTFPRNGIFQANLKHALSSLTSNTRVKNGFYKASYGAKENQVNAMALCRGDVKPAACRSCISRSTYALQKRCPNRKEAVIWYDDCMLRYSNRYFFGNMEFGPWFYMFNLKTVPNPRAFTRALIYLLNNLKFKAASGNSPLKFATGSTAISRNTPKIYALVQCTPDMSKLQCIKCLNSATKLLGKCCFGKQGGRVVAPSCNFRYEIGRFYA